MAPSQIRYYAAISTAERGDAYARAILSAVIEHTATLSAASPSSIFRSYIDDEEINMMFSMLRNDKYEKIHGTRAGVGLFATLTALWRSRFPYIERISLLISSQTPCRASLDISNTPHMHRYAIMVIISFTNIISSGFHCCLDAVHVKPIAVIAIYK